MANAPYSKAYSDAWAALDMKIPQRGARQKYETKDFDQLKSDYTAENGYVITIPGFSDVIKLKPTLMKTPQEIKAEKKRSLERILASPSTDWMRKYGSVMTTIDNIQDTGSIIFPAIRMLARWSPKILARMIPYAGWGLLAFDILQLANMLGRAPFSPMKAKRAACENFRNNPFTKKSQYSRIQRIKNWNPTIADLLQVFQTTADVTGVGLSLGPIVGFATDLAAGAYRTVTGDRVRFSTEAPTLNFHESASAKAMRNAAILNSKGDVFTEEMHLFSYMMFSAGTYFMAPVVEAYDLGGTMENPQEAMIPAPVPTDPITLEVIREAGLDPTAGIGWPMNGEKEISLLDLSNYIIENGRDVFRDFCFRNSHNMQGFFAARLMDDSANNLIDALEPAADYIEEDTPVARLFFTMIKTPILPDPLPTKDQWRRVETWVIDYVDSFERMPPLREIRQKFDALGIKYKTGFPATMDPAAKEFFPDPFSDAEFT